jgi:hypothetical protein
MKNEPSNFHSCCNILWLKTPQVQPGLLQSWREDVKRVTKGKAMPFLGSQTAIALTNEEIIDLWLYAVFAHVSIGRNGDKRKRFEECLEKFGQAPMEYAFRMAVFWMSIPYRNMADHNARPFLAHWWTAGLRPSFKIGSPFGVKLTETTPEGHVLVRKGSSKYYNEESVESMFERVSSRQQHRDMKSLLDSLGVTTSQKLKLVLWSKNVEELIEKGGRELVVEVMTTNGFPVGRPNVRSMFTLFDLPTRTKSVVIVEETKIATDTVGLTLLNQGLQSLRSQLEIEGRESAV